MFAHYGVDYEPVSGDEAEGSGAAESTAAEPEDPETAEGPGPVPVDAATAEVVEPVPEEPGTADEPGPGEPGTTEGPGPVPGILNLGPPVRINPEVSAALFEHLNGKPLFAAGDHLGEHSP